MKPKEVRALTIEERHRELQGAHQELFNLRFQLATRQLQNYRRVREVRRNIARLQTMLNEPEVEEAAV